MPIDSDGQSRRGLLNCSFLLTGYPIGSPCGAICRITLNTARPTVRGPYRFVVQVSRWLVLNQANAEHAQGGTQAA